MKKLLSNLVVSLRLATKSPANTLLCLFVLACGIAIVVSMFRVSKIVLFSHVPYAGSERMVMAVRTGDNNYTDSGLVP
jgi:predicted branched-subunit amino acid permease